jgi:hypothetical protein
MKKMSFALLNLFLFSLSLSVFPLLLNAQELPQVESISFGDVTPLDPGFEAVMNYAQAGKFSGTMVGDKRMAQLDNVITKKNAIVALCKFLGYSGCTLEKAVEIGIVKEIPQPINGQDPLLTVADWVSMLAKAHGVETGTAASPSLWYLGAFLVCKSVKCVPDGRGPMDLITRRDMVNASYIYEKTFAVQTAEQMMIDMENRLMGMRDKLVEPEFDVNVIRANAWANLVKGYDVPYNGRLEAIQYLNNAILVIVDLRMKIGDEEQNKQYVKFFIEKAVYALEDVEPFGTDLLKIAGIEASIEAE